MSRAGARWPAVSLLAAVIAGCGAVAQAASSPRRDAVARTPVRSAAANAQAARDDAASLLTMLNLPSSAASSTSEPAGDDGTLAAPGSGPPDTPNVVDDHGWWVVPGSSQQVLQYIMGHPPAGASPESSGQSVTPGKPTVTDAGFQWPPIPGRLSLRWLIVAVVQLQNGSTGVRADSEVVWITPRPRSERIPAGTQRLVVRTTQDGKTVQGPITVTSRRVIDRVVALVNGLPASQPGVFSCPADFYWRVRLTFYRTTAVLSASPLAVAVIDPSGCGAVQLTLAGKAQPVLADGYTATQRLSAILHVKLSTGVPHNIGLG